MKASLSHAAFVLSFMALFVGSAGAAHRKYDPIEQARLHLEQAHNLLTKKEEGATVKKGKTDIPNIITVLSKAETSLTETKNNKGSSTSVALGLVANAKSELEAAKGGEEQVHLTKADEFIQDALKHVMQAVRVHGAKS